MTSTFFIFFFSLMSVFSLHQTQKIAIGNTVVNDTYANAGNFQGIPYVKDKVVIQNNLATNNIARSNNGLANAGDRTFFYGGLNGVIDNSTFQVMNGASDNVATSRQSSSVGGTQMVVNQINNSIFEEASSTSNNTAQVLGRRAIDEVYAVAGSESQIIRVKDSDLKISGLSTQNQATNNLGGSSLAGTDRSLGNVARSNVKLDSATSNNNARSSGGQAIAGSLNGIGQAVGSRVDLSSNANQNVAESQGGNAVSGVLNSIQLLTGTFTGSPQDKPTLTTSDIASNNVALAESYGKALSGIQTNVRDSTNSYLQLSANSTNNEAIVDGSSDYDPKDAVAGVDFTFGNIHESKVSLSVVADGNVARNYHEDPYYRSDAVAGVQLTIGNADNIEFNAEINSTNNYAYAVFGDAIGGNKVSFYDYNGTLSGTLNKVAENNFAESIYGNAIVENRVTVKNQVLER